MRLRQLDLDLFGQFTGKSYDFGTASPGQPDFHVIYGPNEAGKTTTMDGYLRLLYGFPNREPYDFQHQRKNLKISGILEMDGNAQPLTRLPTRGANLLDAHGAPLPEAALQAHLGGLGLDDYRQLLCLDDETIERGGEEIASSKGDIGRLLFSAAAGVSDLTDVLDKLRADADALYKKRASSTELAQLKHALKEVERRIRDEDVSASAYQKLKQDLEAAQQAEQEIRRESAGLRRRHAQAQAQARALPMLAEVTRLDSALDGFADYPQILDINPEALVDMLARQSSAKTEAARLTDALADLEQRLDALDLAPDALELAADLQALSQLHSRHVTADLDLPRRRAALGALQNDMARAARDLGAPDGTDPMSMVVPQAQMGTLDQLLDRRRDAARVFNTEQAEVAQLTTRLAEAKATLAATDGGTAAPSGVADILARFSVDRLAPAYAAAQAAIQGDAARQTEALEALHLRGLTFDSVPPCPLTADEAEDLASRHTQGAEKLDQARAALDALRRESDSLTAQIDLMTGAQGVLTDDAAQKAIAARDALWQAHRVSLSENSADAFAAAMAQVDSQSATRLSQAAELGKLRHLAEQEARIGVEITHAEAALDVLQASQDQLRRPLTAAAAAADLPAELAPHLLAGWVRRRDAAAQAARRLDQTRANHAPVLDKAAQLTRALAPLVALEAPDFEALLAAARNLHSAEQAQAERSAKARAARDGIQADLAARNARLADLEAAVQQAQAQWAAQVADLFDNALDPDVLARSFDPLRNLQALSVQHRDISRQIKGMEADQTTFAARIGLLAATQGLAPASDPLALCSALGDLAKAAEQAQAEHDQLTAARDAAASALAETKATLARIDAQVAQQAQIFPAHVATGTLPDLRAAVATAQDVIAKRAQRRNLAAQICTDLSVDGLEAARQALDGTASADLTAEIAGLEADLDNAEQRLGAAIETRTTAANALAAVTGASDIAELTERRATLEAQIEDTALRYLELDLGHRLAEEAIRRYRDSHRGTMMDATEKAFAELTDGAYTRLMTRPDGKTETLLAQDAAGTTKEAQDMSKGTRFQLYLALRAAAYEQLASQGTCLPFFCDDIFETFDEDRTRAACRLMARIGRTGQAIYLTHHRHVVDIAQQECGDGVTIHHIQSTP